MRVSKHFRVFDYFLKCMQSFRPTCKMLVRDFEPRIDIKLPELLTKLTLIYREVIIYIYIYIEREREREFQPMMSVFVIFALYYCIVHQLRQASVLTWSYLSPTCGQTVRKRKGMLVRGIVILARANGMITIRGSEMCSLAWKPNITMRGITISVGQRL